MPPATPTSHKSAGAPTGPRSIVGHHTVQNYGKNGENQDAYIASTSGTKSLVAVLDGHGQEQGFANQTNSSQTPEGKNGSSK